MLPAGTRTRTREDVHLLLQGGGRDRATPGVPQLLGFLSRHSGAAAGCAGQKPLEIWAHCDSETFKTFSRRDCRDHLLQHLH